MTQDEISYRERYVHITPLPEGVSLRKELEKYRGREGKLLTNDPMAYLLAKTMGIPVKFKFSRNKFP